MIFGMRYLQIFLFLCGTFPVFGQQVLDTIPTDRGTMLIYSDRTWIYMEDLNFTGVMNERLHKEILSDSTLDYILPWDNEISYTSHLKNDLSKLRDTIWLCVSGDGNGGFAFPCDGAVTSSYGWRSGRPHNGTDIDLETGDTVRAAWSGKVRYAKYNDGGFGNLVIIRHDNGLETFYAHLSKFSVAPNQEVKAGEPIGLGGNTGHSYGSHLHFEVRFYDAPMDPAQIIDFQARDVKDDNLMVHKGLFRPGAKAEVAGTTTVPAEKEAVTASSTAASAKKYYKIKSGDTLSGIAQKNKTTVSKLCQLNNIKPTTVLQLGRNLRVR
jgi:hypothetical protein